MDALLASFVIGIAALMGIAAVHKLLALARFADELGDYQLLPRRLVTPMAIAIPGLELASTILTAIPATFVFGVTLMGALLVVFSGALTANLIRGRTSLHCACFGATTRTISWALPLRNLFLVAIVVLALITSVDSAEINFPAMAATLLCASAAALLLQADELWRSAPDYSKGNIS